MFRKLFVVAILLVALTAGAFAGGQDEGGQATEPAGEADGPDLSIMQAPQLADMVEAGDLPPLEERLPENPLVVEPFESLGVYGGTVYPGRVTVPNNPISADSTNLLIYDPEHSELSPHLASSWEASDDLTEFEITLRRGVKWSDGEEFNVDDIMFFWNVFTTPETWPQGPLDFLVSGNGTPAEFTRVDDYTFRMTFDGPMPTLLDDLAAYWSHHMTRTPEHYLSQYHPDYVDMEDLEALADEEGYENVAVLFEAKADWFETRNPERPTLAPYVLVQGAPSDPMIYERNPYFWAVDPEGRQLPYIDQVVYNISSDQEVLNLRILNGDIDWTRFTVSGQLPLYMQNREDGQYRVSMWTTIEGSTDVLMYNQSTPNLQKRELFGDVRFRRAMSHAVDREEINELVYQGLAGAPSQFAPAEDSPYYNPELTSSYVEYDPERTRELLDEMGLPVDDDGYRTFPNGDRLQINVVAPTEQRNIGPVAELWIDYMDQVGIRANLRGLDRTAWQTIIEANSSDIDATVFWGDPFFDLQLDTLRTLTPQAPWISWWAPGYAIWLRSDGEAGVEPPEIHKRTFELVQQLQVETDAERALEIGRELTDIAAENVWTMGTLRPPELPVVTTNRLRNVAQTGVFKWYTMMRVQKMYQWYIDPAFQD